jgi:hypothetical protein
MSWHNSRRYRRIQRFVKHSASLTHAEAIFADARTQLNIIAQKVHRHLDHEEVALTPLLYNFTIGERSAQRNWQSIDTQTWRESDTVVTDTHTGSYSTNGNH